MELRNERAEVDRSELGSAAGFVRLLDALALLDPPDWHAGAACAGLNRHGQAAQIFFPSRGETSRIAKDICGACPVQLPCLRYAITHHEVFGIWGSASERTRRRLRREWLATGRLPGDPPLNKLDNHDDQELAG